MARKENALDLGKFIDKGVRVKLSGGREGSQQTAGSTAHLSCRSHSQRSTVGSGSARSFERLRPATQLGNGRDRGVLERCALLQGEWWA